MNLPASIAKTYPLAASCRVAETFHPDLGWGVTSRCDFTIEGLRNLAACGYTMVSLSIADADGIHLAYHADFRLEELLEDAPAPEGDAEVVRVRGINVNAFERGLDSPVEMWEDELRNGVVRAGRSWIEGPRGWLLDMAVACSVGCDAVIEEMDHEWCESTPDWMREQNCERMIAAAERACDVIFEQVG